MNDDDTKKATMSEFDDDLRPEYDMGKFLKHGVRGNHAQEYREFANVVLLAPDVFEVFKSSEAVNEALRLVIKIRELETKRDTTAKK